MSSEKSYNSIYTVFHILALLQYCTLTLNTDSRHNPTVSNIIPKYFSVTHPSHILYLEKKKIIYIYAYYCYTDTVAHIDETYSYNNTHKQI